MRCWPTLARESRPWFWCGGCDRVARSTRHSLEVLARTQPAAGAVRQLPRGPRHQRPSGPRRPPLLSGYRGTRTLAHRRTGARRPCGARRLEGAAHRSPPLELDQVAIRRDRTSGMSLREVARPIASQPQTVRRVLSAPQLPAACAGRLTRKQDLVRKINAKGPGHHPAELRRQLGLRPGTRVVMWQQDGCIRLQSLTSWKHQQRARSSRDFRCDKRGAAAPLPSC